MRNLFSISRDSKTNKENLHENDSANNSRRSSLTGTTRYVTFLIFQTGVKNFKKTELNISNHNSHLNMFQS